MSQNDTKSFETIFKDRLAWIVFLFSASGIIAIGVLVITNSSGKSDAAEKVFATIVPLFATWVGTILAFYFARENFDSANMSVRRLVDRITPEQQLGQISVRQAMKPFSKITSLSATNPETDVSVRQIIELVEKGNSRIPIFAEQQIRFVVHESTLNKYLAEVLSRSSGNPPLDLSKVRLAELLAHKVAGSGDVRAIVTKFAFVPVGASLRDARDEMLRVKGAQDVFVTESGAASEKVQGWLTNSDITRDLNL